jgi:murein peptide amidase A
VIHGVDLWLVPTYNPDGIAANTRRNGHGVDLNRNYPYHWVDLDGNYESGPHAASEPETRAMMKLLSGVRPDYVLSFHQPLHGVDTDTKRPKFSRKVAHYLHLPVKTLSCGGVCHGTMTGWYNHHFDGLALTVEYGAHPPARLMQQVAPRQVLRIFGAFGSFGGV